jgi:hypothetical protein
MACAGLSAVLCNLTTMLKSAPRIGLVPSRLHTQDCCATAALAALTQWDYHGVTKQPAACKRFACRTGRPLPAQ